MKIVENNDESAQLNDVTCDQGEKSLSLNSLSAKMIINNNK